MEQNYLPLFRKYRPQSFKDVVGQESLVKALSNAIELNRIANAYLFCGPRGTGKTSSARILAKSLNCEHGPTLEPCQKCASCVDITNASGLDVIEIDAASNRGIQDAKDLIAQVQYAPINGKYKIFIIDEVHMLSNDAFNALLKTFEEPPKNVIFILATTEPHKVLETIVSRCQRFDLRRITTNDIVKRLREISDIENIKITDEALFTIAKNVSGGLRDSLALLDQVSILGVKEEISKDLIEELLGKINLDVLLKLLNNIINQDVENSLLTIDAIYSKGNEPRNLSENFIEFLRNVILVTNSSNTENIKNFTSLIDEDIQKIKSFNFDKDKLIKILNIFIEYYKEIKISTNPYLWTELAAIAASKPDLVLEVQKIQNIPQKEQQTPVKTFEKELKTDSLKEEISKKPTEQEKQTQEPEKVQDSDIKSEKNSAISSEVVQKQDGAQIWLNVLDAIPSLPTRALYSGTSKLVSVKDNKITLGFTHENALNQAKMPNKLNILEKALKSLYPDLELEFIKITPETKTIEVKSNFASKPQYNNSQNQSYQYQDKQTQNSNYQSNSTYSQNYSNQETTYSQKNEFSKPRHKSFDDFDDEDFDEEKKYYSPKVQEMIEQFGGRIVE